MGHYEDLWYDITKSIEEEGLKKQFDKQLKKMSSQEHHRFKDSRAKWEYSYKKVLEGKRK